MMNNDEGTISGGRFTVDLGATGRVWATGYPANRAWSLGATLVLAHGAGAGQSSSFLVRFATNLAAAGLDLVTFDFPYIAAGRRLPDPPAILEACYRAAIDRVLADQQFGSNPLFIGGKSMGGRIATHLAAADDLPQQVVGVVLLGYPLHPPGRPAQLRARHLPQIRLPLLFVQGSRDGFGTPDELRPVLQPLGPRATIHVIEGGDHSFKVATSWPVSQDEVYAEAQQAILGWTRTTLERGRHAGS